MSSLDENSVSKLQSDKYINILQQQKKRKLNSTGSVYEMQQAIPHKCPTLFTDAYRKKGDFVP